MKYWKVKETAITFCVITLFLTVSFTLQGTRGVTRRPIIFMTSYSMLLSLIVTVLE